ncbi:hypothetical protein BJ138DRAFT_1162027 [Hygrophoropsis aurantiaca]|uniref:Uncharacterized protein n=1 Tax=Hygrophoropsis aurantiaca TaxID=72124 RepID=A0ACB8A0L1_9AGAM|nr:hypothetical protein BJ138DRAFT_1162027 [Hygrophoropsis aurantiaca]
MADPALIQTLWEVQTENYVAAAACALVIYDQVLMFSREIDHIWNREWNSMTALYVVARYSGDLQVITNATMYICINWTTSDANMMIATGWGLIIFILAMQAILMIRVYALFNRSKKVLIFLTTLHAFQTTAIFVMTALVINKQALHAFVISVSPAIGSVAQYFTLNPPLEYLPFNQATTCLAVGFDIMLFFFALWAFVRHAMEAKKLDGGWSINVLVKTLMTDHLVYFVCNLTSLLIILSTNYKPSGFIGLCMIDISSGLVVIAGPHMMISLRETEKKTRGEGGTVEGEVSTIRFGARELPAQSESVVEEGEGFRATDEHSE